MENKELSKRDIEAMMTMGIMLVEALSGTIERFQKSEDELIKKNGERFVEGIQLSIQIILGILEKINKDKLKNGND